MSITKLDFYEEWSDIDIDALNKVVDEISHTQGVSPTDLRSAIKHLYSYDEIKKVNEEINFALQKMVKIALPKNKVVKKKPPQKYDKQWRRQMNRCWWRNEK
jgi:hypothetical protein